jgi:tetratricopeptide (TPR) repeat protein
LAVELQPDLSIAHHGFSILLNLLRRSEEALAEARKAVALDPLTPLFQAHEGWILHCLGRDEEAFRVLQSALEIFPNDYYLLRIVLYCCSTGGRRDLAVAATQKISALAKDSPSIRGILGFGAAASHKPEEARKIAQELKEQWKGDASAAYGVGLVHTALGDKQEAIAWLDKANDSGLGLILIINVEPVFDSLRSEPGFQALVRKLGLQP